MRTVDITTSQNVTIRYELASFRDRFVAWLTDIVIIFASVLLLVAIIALWIQPLVAWPYIMTGLIPALYHLAFEIAYNGQTPGKRAMGIRVVKLDGRQPSIPDYVIRWAFRLIDLTLSFGTIGAALVSSGNRSQRLGDILSNTVVIKLLPSHSVYLQDLLRIQSAEDYQPRFDGVNRFTEEEMLLIKEVLDRSQCFPNEAHSDALSQLAEKVSARLGVSKPDDSSDLLRGVLKDYVVMTR